MPEMTATPRRTSEFPKWALALGLVVFVVGLILAIPSLEFDPSASSLAWVAAAALIGVPIMTLSNALEFRKVAELREHDVHLAEAVEVAVSSTAANLLPLPGGPMVKIAALKRAGSSVGGATMLTVWTGALWLAVAIVVAGSALLIDGRPVFTFAIAAGLVLGAVSAFALQRQSTTAAPGRAIVALAGIELVATLGSALRLWFVGNALGVTLGLGVFVIALAPVLGAAVVLVPSGWGVRELVAAGLAVLAGLAAATGFVVTALDRVIGLVVHGSAAAALLWRRSRSQ